MMRSNGLRVRFFGLSALVCCSLAVSITATSAQAPEADTSGAQSRPLNKSGPLTADSETLIVNLAPGANKQEVAEILQEVNGIVTETIESKRGGIFLIIKTEKKKFEETEKKLTADKHFQAVMRNYEVQMRQRAPFTLPNDPYFPSETHLGFLKASQAFQEFKTRKSYFPLLVIIDTGCSPVTSGDSGTKILNGFDFNTGSAAANATGSDHGTLVFNVAAAQADNRTGVASLAPCPVLPIRAGGLAAILRAFQYIENLSDRGYKMVVNMSWGFPSPYDLNNARAYRGFHEIFRGTYADGNVLWFQAAENEPRRDPNPRLSYFNVVAGLDARGKRASFSGYGPHISYVAQADQVFTIYRGRPLLIPGNSFSCPQVASVACWMWAENPSLKAPKVNELLARSCQFLPGLTREQQGYGLPNVADALRLATGRAKSSSSRGMDDDPFAKGEDELDLSEETLKNASEKQQRLFDDLYKERGAAPPETETKAPAEPGPNTDDASKADTTTASEAAGGKEATAEQSSPKETRTAEPKAEEKAGDAAKDSK